MTQENKQSDTPPTATDSLALAAKAMVERLIFIEQEPDLVSVFAIARAHGYKITSKFWHAELSNLANAYSQYDKAQKALAQEAKPVAEVIPMNPESPLPPG